MAARREVVGAPVETLRGAIANAQVGVETSDAAFDHQMRTHPAKGRAASAHSTARERQGVIDQLECGAITDGVVSQACLMTSVPSEDLIAPLRHEKMEPSSQIAASGPLAERVVRGEALVKEAHVENVVDAVLATTVDLLHEESEVITGLRGAEVFRETVTQRSEAAIAELRRDDHFAVSKTSTRRLIMFTAQRAHTLSIVEIPRLSLAVTDSIVVEGVVDHSVVGLADKLSIIR